MGICGLNSFLKLNPQLSIEAKLHNQKLVIDGKNLAFHLFMQACNSARFNDWRCDVYGGNMVGYAEAVRSFFEKINMCNIEAIVVVSGRRNIDDESTLLKVQHQFDEAKSIWENTQDDNIVVPSCIKTVFSSVLEDLGIKVHVANSYTATIRDLANENNCPVLTNDGAFFIYALKKGHILLDSFDHEKLDKLPEGSGHCFRECSIYKQEKLLQFFPKLNLTYMPLLAVSLTYTKSNNLKRVSQGLSHIRHNSRLCCQTEPQKRIVQLLAYLEGKPLRVILNFFLSRFELREQPGVWVRIQDAMIGYWSLNEDNLETKIQSFYHIRNGREIAAYLAAHFTSGDVNTILYDIISGQVHFNYPEIDDLEQAPSFHMMLRPLTVVLALMKKPLVQKEANQLILYDQPFCKHTLDPLDDLDGFGSLKRLNIHDIMELSLEEKKKLIYSTFRFDAETYDKITQLMTVRMKDKAYIHEAIICMLLLRYINSEAQSNGVENHVKPEFMGALLVAILFYAAENGNVDYPEGYKFGKLMSLSVKNSTPTTESNPGIYRQIMHLIAELQTAYKAFFLLNTLLDYPVQQPKIELFFNGVLIYRVTRELLASGWDNGKILLDYGFQEDCSDVTPIVLV